jgi:ATP-dependent Clp protease protease subunit
MKANDNEVNINIYGDITSWPMQEGDTSAANLSRQLEQLGDVSRINVFINSYGGEVAEGVAIYNALKRHKAKVVTYCDGFAASIASVIFMAGDERIMNEASALMIHNAWTFADGNADQLRKLADDLDKITQLSVTAYKANSNLSEDEIKALMDAETWILPAEALEYGFATSVEKIESKRASQNARASLIAFVQAMRQKCDEEENDAGAIPAHAGAIDNAQEKFDDENLENENLETENPDAGTEETKNNAAQKWISLFEKSKNI